MVHIKVTRGLDIPIKGKPKSTIKKNNTSQAQEFNLNHPKQIALNLYPFASTKFKLLVKEGDTVKIGQPLAIDKTTEGRFFVSPAGGVVKEIRRGLKRRLLDIVIDVAEKEEHHNLDPLEPETSSREAIIEKLKAGGLFAHIRKRPFNQLADPHKEPRSIFVKAVETAPFVPPAEMQVEGHESDFQIGLNALSKLTKGKVHLVYHQDTTCEAFLSAKNVEKHTVEGPHPAGNHSVHIQEIDPITSAADIIWTLNAYDVVVLGHLLRTGHYLTEKVISIAGPGILEGRTGYYQLRTGYPVTALIENRLPHKPLRLISGDPLLGKKIENNDFLGFYDFGFTVIPENLDREMLHFFRLGTDKYTFSKTYLTGHIDNTNKQYDFTTSQHGEHRAFIDAALYDKVQAVNVNTMPLVKAVMAEDFDLAEELGLLSVDTEDFALPTFVCPSKMEMTEIIRDGLAKHASEMGAH